MTEKAKRVAEQAMPGWRAVSETADSFSMRYPMPEPDAVGSDMAALRRKYLGDAGKAAAARTSSLDVNPDEPTEFIAMEPTASTDSVVGRKIAVVKGKRVIGTQG